MTRATYPGPTAGEPTGAPTSYDEISELRREIVVAGRVVERPLPEGWAPDPQWDRAERGETFDDDYLVGPPEPIWWRRMVDWYIAWRNRP